MNWISECDFLQYLHVLAPMVTIRDSEFVMLPTNCRPRIIRNRSSSGNPSFDQSNYASVVTDVFVGQAKELFRFPTIKLCQLSPIIDGMVKRNIRRDSTNLREEWDLSISSSQTPEIKERLKVALEAVMKERNSRHPRENDFDIVESAEVIHLTSCITIPKADIEAFRYVAQYIETGKLSVATLIAPRNCDCDCGSVKYAALKYHLHDPICQKHDLTVQVRLIQLATELKMEELASCAMDELLHACGAYAMTADLGEPPGRPHTICITRLAPAREPGSIKKVRIVVAEDCNEDKLQDFWGQCYRLHSIIDGEYSDEVSAREGRIVTLGAFQVTFEFECKAMTPAQNEDIVVSRGWKLGHSLWSWWSN